MSSWLDQTGLEALILKDRQVKDYEIVTEKETSKVFNLADQQ